jgi:hypothetical protein
MDTPRRRRDVRFWLLAFLAIVVFHTCVRIEILNQLAGDILPRKSPTKWRAGVMNEKLNEKWWRLFHLHDEDEDVRLTRALTVQERQEMEYDVFRERANALLRTTVEVFGLWQYVLAPICLIWSIRAAKNRRRAKRIAAGVFTVTSAVSIVLMFYRGYFTSLGG